MNLNYSEWQLFVSVLTGNWALCQSNVISRRASEIGDLGVKQVTLRSSPCAGRIKTIQSVSPLVLPPLRLLINYCELLNSF